MENKSQDQSQNQLEQYLNILKERPKILPIIMYNSDIKSFSQSAIRSKDRPKEVKNLVLIVSALNPPSKPVNILNNQVRNVFGPEDILKQTLISIRTAREKISNSYIIFVEGTKTSTDTDKAISSKVDEYVNFSENKICNLFVEGRDKGLGDSYLILLGLLYIWSTNIKFDRLFKIPQRYYLGKRFDLEEYMGGKDNKPIVTQLMNHTTGYGNTAMGGIVSINYESLWIYLTSVLYSVLYTFIGLSLTVEHSFYDSLLSFSDNNVHSPEFAGFDGYSSVDGTLKVSGEGDWR